MRLCELVAFLLRVCISRTLPNRIDVVVVDVPRPTDDSDAPMHVLIDGHDDEVVCENVLLLRPLFHHIIPLLCMCVCCAAHSAVTIACVEE